MISDPKFSTVKAALSLPGNVRLSEYWSLAFQAGEPGTQGDVRPEPRGGIRLNWEGTAEIVRLSQDLDVSPSPLGAHFDVEVTLNIETQAVDTDLIQSVAIQWVSDTGVVRHSLHTETIPSAEVGACIIVARAEAIPIKRESSELCIDIDIVPKELILRSVEGELRQIDPTRSWKMLKEDKNFSGNDESAGPALWASSP